MARPLIICVLLALLLAACGGDDGGNQAAVFQATLPANENNVIVLTETTTPSPTNTMTVTPSPTVTLTPTSSPTPTVTPSPTPTITPTPSLTPTPSPSPTQPLFTLTAPAVEGAPATYDHLPANFSAAQGWSCGEFPCAADVGGFLRRIQVPAGYQVAHTGRFPGQPVQITYGPDDRLYATVLENGTRAGTIYVMGDDGSARRYSNDIFFSPAGLAFQPGTDDLYVSARIERESGIGLWRITPDGVRELIIDDLPCCFSILGNGPNGMVFGPDGYLYMGVGGLTDHAEPAMPEAQRYADIFPLEASILRIQPHTAEVEVYAQGVRQPQDLTFDAAGQFYGSDNGTIEGPGDRLLRIDAGANYGWPYWRTRGCRDCPPTGRTFDFSPDLLRLPDYTLPRGLVAYTGTQFPQNVFGSLFIALWGEGRVVRVDPAAVPDDLGAAYTPEPFVTGLIHPVDVALAPDGTLVVADFIYGHVWQVSYTGTDTPRPDLPTPYPSALPRLAEVQPETVTIAGTEQLVLPTIPPFDTPTAAEATPEATSEPDTDSAPSLFVTSTPRP